MQCVFEQNIGEWLKSVVLATSMSLVDCWPQAKLDSNPRHVCVAHWLVVFCGCHYSLSTPWRHCSCHLSEIHTHDPDVENTRPSMQYLCCDVYELCYWKVNAQVSRLTIYLKFILMTNCQSLYTVYYH